MALPMSSMTRMVTVFGLAFVVLTYFIWQHPSTANLIKSTTATATATFAFQGCSPGDWADGTWENKSNSKAVVEPSDVYEASGFLGCASNREVEWHLGNDHPDLLSWRGHISAYEWTPQAARCEVPDDREALVIDLVENGGWLLIGDSVTQEHFFSLSCTLYPHVIATPDYAGRYDWDRAWPQNLYLNPASPLTSQVKMPEGFEIDKTPLVTFRRDDLLFNRTELASIHYGGRIPTHDTLFGEEASWDMSPVDYFALFDAPLPEANYRTMIVSSAGHWSTKVFAGLEGGLPDVHNLYRNVVNNWVYQAGMYLDAAAEAAEAAGENKTAKEVIVRPYLPGDDACHTPEILWGGPLPRPRDLTHASYNWQWIPRFNTLFEQAVMQRSHPNLHFLAGLEWPGRLRPDTHNIGDCLHLTVGAGVIEDWTRYIHYYTSTYLPLLRRGNRFALSRISLW